MADDGSEFVLQMDNEEEAELYVEEDDGRDWKKEERNGLHRQVEEDIEKNLEAILEKYRLEIGGLPKHYPIGQLKKLLNNTLQLDAHRVKPGGMGRNNAYVSFKSDDARSKAMLVIEGYKWNSVTLTCKYADAKSDPVKLAKIDYLKVPRKEHENLSLNERIKKAVIPLDDLSYKEQLATKEKVALSIMRKFGTELTDLNPELAEFVHWQKVRRKGQICEVDPIVPSPVRDGYRNKCEFTIGKNYENDGPCVGFRVAAYKKGSVEVGPVHHLRHINPEMKKVCKLMENHIRNSGYEPFDPFTHDGVWRQLTVRTTNTGDILLVIVIHPQQMEDEEIIGIKQDVVSFFTVGQGQAANITSMFIQTYGQLESGVPVEYEHMWGKTFIEELISGKRFRASPDAFLQVNTHACEVLYNTIGELIDVDSTTCLLDICCGVGTIGLSLAEQCYKVIGVDNVSEAIDNARANSELNGLTNVVYYNGTAEVFIDRMLERAEKSHSVAIVDPPRAGLNGSVMNALRKCDYLDRLVYISCDPSAALPNFQALCRPRSKNYKGSYFVPVKAVPIDMFPGTDHYELVILFERYDECKWNRIMSGNPRPKDQAYFDRVPELRYNPEEERRLLDTRSNQNYYPNPYNRHHYFDNFYEDDSFGNSFGYDNDCNENYFYNDYVDPYYRGSYYEAPRWETSPRGRMGRGRSGQLWRADAGCLDGQQRPGSQGPFRHTCGTSAHGTEDGRWDDGLSDGSRVQSGVSSGDSTGFGPWVPVQKSSGRKNAARNGQGHGSGPRRDLSDSISESRDELRRRDDGSGEKRECWCGLLPQSEWEQFQRLWYEKHVRSGGEEQPPRDSELDGELELGLQWLNLSGSRGIQQQRSKLYQHWLGGK